MTSFQKLIEDAIDDIVKEIDYDIWKGAYNKKTAEEPEFVDDYRQSLYVKLEDLYWNLREAGLR